MRERTPAATLLAMAVSGLVLAGCVDDDGSATTSPSASAPAASTPTASAAAAVPVAGCVTGNWRSTTVSAHAASGTTSANLSGGSGVAVAVGPNGETVIDFSKMQPVDFTTKAAGSQVTGNFTFSGQVSATVRTGTASASPTTSASASASASTSTSPGGATPGMAGTWEPVPPINWGDTRVTVDLTAPVKVRPVDNIRIADYVGDGASRTGNVVDIEPLLGKGQYQCQGDSLILTPDGGGMSWRLTRT